MGASPDLGFARSYYAATANPLAAFPRLEGDHDADLCVIGGGYTGLSAALSAAERGLSVILLEAGAIGSGASGRNGGQMIPGWRKGAVELIARYGAERARALFNLSLEARDLTVDRIARHNIACDLKTSGHLLVAAKPGDLSWMREETSALDAVMGYGAASVLTRDEARARLASPLFHGGFLDAGGGHLHPLNYARGLADAARKAGVRIFEHSAALSYDAANGVNVRGDAGNVRARYGVLACDALLDNLEPRIAGRVMPVGSYQIATAPLPDPGALIKDGLAVSDTRFVVNYFRVSADGRLIFSGGERYTRDPPSDIAAFVRPYMVKVFPQLADLPIERAWGGLVSITMTRLPHVGRFGDMYFAHGYSGHGVLLASVAGAAIAQAVGGDAKRFDLLASLAPGAFPGGAGLRGPLYIAGMLYYALRDRL